MNSGVIHASRRFADGLVLFVLVSCVGCGPTVRRDLSTIPQRQITFDDRCRMQEYFDQRNASHARPGFHAVEEISNETTANEPDEHGRMRHAMIGEGTYLVSDRSARVRLQRVLADEYADLPAFDARADGVQVTVHVGWWASGEVRRLRPDRRIVVSNGRQTVDLPFDPCVGEFLFGAPVYALRRSVLDAEAARARGEIPATSTDAPGSAVEPSSASETPSEGRTDAGLTPSERPNPPVTSSPRVSPGG